MENHLNISDQMNRELIYKANIPSYVYLIGWYISSFEYKLPRVIDVLRFYFHFEKIKDSEVVSRTTKEIQQIYQHVEIPIIHFESIRSKVKRIVSSVKRIIETRKSNSQSQTQKEFKFFQKSLQLFEVTQNESSLSDRKRTFLTDQRTARQELVTNMMVTIHYDQRASTSGYQANSIPVYSTDSFDTSSSSSNLLGIICHSLNSVYSTESAQTSNDFQVDFVDQDNSPDFVPSRAISSNTIHVSDGDKKELSECGASYRIIEKVLAIGIKTAGGQPNDYAISKTALCSQLSTVRSSNTTKILGEIESNEEKIILHFDGKKFQKINQKHIGKETRMVAMCHTPTKDVPLGLPILNFTLAESYAAELYRLCEHHNVINRIAGLVCDTTATNSGRLGGVCALFQDKIEMDVLNLMCRHHVFEVLLSSAFTAAFGAIEAPTITLFEVLNANWVFIKDEGFPYLPCEESELELFQLLSFYDNAQETLLHQSKCKQIRDDYAELTDLCLKFLGIQTSKPFMVPGALSKSRWMAKAIYSIKTYLFRDQLELEDDFVQNLLEFSSFVALVYCRHWNRCTNAVNAAVNDLQLIKELQEYREHSDFIANAVLNSFENHLWYLGEELVIMSLFSDIVSVDDKNRMRVKILSSEYPNRGENSLRLQQYLNRVELPSLVTPRSRFFFSVLNLKTDFLTKPAESWNRNKIYHKNKKLVNNWIFVVNDLAERALGRADQIIKNQRARSEERFQNMFLSLYS